MDNFIKELKEKEEKTIVEGMAFMSYGPSIGRALEKGGAEEFQETVVERAHKLKKISTQAAFDKFHNGWVLEFIRKVKTNQGSKCTYGQAQKAINVFLKVFVDWANLPDRKTAKRIKKFLHVPLDSVVMKTVKKEYPQLYQKTIRPLQSGFSLSKLERKAYNKWQELFRQKYPQKPLLFDVAWWLRRLKSGKKP